MYISYVEKIQKKKVRVTLEDYESFVMAEKDWNALGYDIGDDLSEEFLTKLYHDYFLSKCRLKALSLLKTRDHSEKELMQKLKKSGYPDTVIHDTMTYIDSYHYIDDTRYAANYIAYKSDCKSRKELKYALSMKGIDLNSIMENDSDIELPDDKKTIKNLLIKRWGEHPSPDIKEKERMTRYLARHGFCAGDVYSIYHDLGI